MLLNGTLLTHMDYVFIFLHDMILTWFIMLQLAASSVRAGQTVTISPEGTRSPSGLLLPFKKGPFYLWEAMQQQDAAPPVTAVQGMKKKRDDEGCLVQPVLISGAFALFPPASLFSAPGVAQVRMLEPIRPSELGTGACDGSPAALSRDRDAMSSVLRRRLLHASLSPVITTGKLLDTPIRTALTPSERALSVLILFCTLFLCLFFFLFVLLVVLVMCTFVFLCVF